METGRRSIAGDIERTEQGAVGIFYWRAGADQKAVGIEKVFRPADHQRGAGGQGRADGIGALAAFGPVGPWLQGYLFGAAQEAGVAIGMQQQSVRAGQHRHAARAGQLPAQLGHDRGGLSQQGPVLFPSQLEFRARQAVEVGGVLAAQAVGGGTGMRVRDQVGMAGQPRDGARIESGRHGLVSSSRAH